MKITPARLYLTIIILAFVWCAAIIAAPILEKGGHSESAGLIYSFFSRICHQNDHSSFHYEGEKFGVCIRCSAIYFGFFAGLLVIPLFGGFSRKIVPNGKLLIVILLPMLIDVMLNMTGIHYSNPATRIVTGFISGLALPWWILPEFIDALMNLIKRNKTQHQIQE